MALFSDILSSVEISATHFTEIYPQDTVIEIQVIRRYRKLEVSIDGISTLIGETVAPEIPTLFRNHHLDDFLSYESSESNVHQMLLTHMNMDPRDIDFFKTRIARYATDIAKWATRNGLRAFGFLAKLQFIQLEWYDGASELEQLMDYEDDDDDEGVVTVDDDDDDTTVALALIDLFAHTFQGEDTACAICLDSLVAGSKVARLACNHIFHGPCIATWFERSYRCPLCRFEVI